MQWLPLIVRKKSLCGVMVDAIKPQGGIKEACAQISRLGYTLSPEEVQEIGEMHLEECYVRGVCILDEGHPPAPMNRPAEGQPPKIPVCLKRAWEAKYLPYETRDHLRHILALAEGDYLPETLSDEEAYTAVMVDARHQPVEVRLCLEEGCDRLAVTTVENAASVIRREKLLDKKGRALYAPYRRCEQHGKEREAARRAMKQEAPAPAPTPAPAPAPSAAPLRASIADQNPELVALIARQVTEQLMEARASHLPTYNEGVAKTASPEELLIKSEEEEGE